ncbi:hypothetical protein [Marinobacter adhaerens]|uniref:hypothetical protein n=1 Tax=Marinobacter adhaerens TaxID=1033846 RepID=UPI001C586E75|nr:hypothetical protein [Marinobacter adhaerens]MBW3225487.1 hypothetical protein [Marinobacter adhaerens]
MKAESQKSFMLTRDIMEALRNGNVEPLAHKIETGGGVIFLSHLHPEDRARFARLVRTGDPLHRGEKRQNNFECKCRDCFLITKIFYWLGSGLPGFSNTATDTAFDRAVQDYENEIIPSAPSRTAESLYRHGWKPFLQRYHSGNTTPEDESMVQPFILSQFLLGMRRSEPNSKEAKARLEWFYQKFVSENHLFSLSISGTQNLKAMLNISGMRPDLWRPYIREATSRAFDIDEILFT